MPYKADKILTGLYQGGAPPAGDVLAKSGVDALVLCAREHQRADMYEGIEVILAPGDDDPRPHRLAQFIDGWKKAALQVAERVKSGKVVLVTCMQGLNRSGLVNALAMRELTGWSGKRIVEHIQQRREDALFNDSFVRYILKSFPE